MIHLTTMTMQLIDNDPDGIRICRVEGESLVTIVVPRDKLAEAKRLPNVPERGVYYLLDEDHGVLGRVYAGQTTQGLARLEDHKAKKEFWNKAVMFLDGDINIDRDVLDALEAKAIDFVQRNGSYETDNTYLPSPHVNPYKEQRVEKLHESMLFRMKVLGYDLNRSETAAHVSEGFHTKKNGISATGKYDKVTGRFTVLAGSEVELRRGIIKNRGAIAAREQLFGSQKGKAKLDHDVTFASPSTAAVFVLGGSQNGWTEWVNDQGKTLDEVYRNKEHMNE
ncbi:MULTISPECIES: GIY-YIG nuclease family protein [Bifidobacterium]|uniref:GIY-YIG nuclease family protein n=1 Tax=Bifidobacterium TaxID=1678 RepID=UPI001BDD485A|nr:MULTISPECIES: GIY-YIG nuclease family protein [Bifidobacterium]MBT1160709.1 GIY-YIG nuclease family protein [Bifidobacterium sp. SO1]MBW3077874.1 GIY-YIG nuclease family protein [Bifidobacterium simiiventris]